MGESFLFSSDLISRSIAGHAPVDESGWKARGVQELPCFPVIFLSFSTFASVSLQHNGNGCKRRHHRERLFCNLCSSTLPNLTECGNIGGQNAIITRFLPWNFFFFSQFVFASHSLIKNKYFMDIVTNDEIIKSLDKYARKLSWTFPRGTPRLICCCRLKDDGVIILY